MPVVPSLSQIKDALQAKINKAGEYWFDKQPADMGNYAGVVPVPDKESQVYVRLANGQVVEAFNNVAPNIYNWKVYVGRDKSQPALFRVLEVRWIYNLAQTVAYVLFHHKQHEYPAPDTVSIRRDQFLPLLVLPRGGFHVRLFGDIIYNASMAAPIKVANVDDIDLSSYAVSTGARYVLLEVQTDGTLNYVVGDTVASRGILELTEPIPTPTAGSFPVCVFEFFEGQTELRRDSEERTIIDLRMFTSEATPTTGMQIGDGPADTPADGDKFGFWDIVDLTLKSITWANLKILIKTILALDDLTDVDVPSPTDGQLLTYDAYAGVWIASDPIPAGQYRQFVYEVSGGDFTFVIDEGGNPVMALEDLE